MTFPPEDESGRVPPADRPTHGAGAGMVPQAGAMAAHDHDHDLAARLRRFETSYFPRLQDQFHDLVERGQHPTVIFIGCSDSRVVPYLLMDAGPGELFMVRNVGNFVPPYDASQGYHGTVAAIEFALMNFDIRHIVVCGHSHCGAIRALYQDVPAEARHMKKWLELGQDARLPVMPGEEALRRTEQRSVVLQLERLMEYPLVQRRVAEGRVFLHGWHYLIDEGQVRVLDIHTGRFEPVAPGNMIRK
jgi:carbonic anhydrase